jgi:hypothetical protein
MLARLPAGAADGLAVLGVLAAAIIGAGAALPLDGEPAEWVHWLVLGAALPVAAICAARLPADALLFQLLAMAGAAAVGWYVVRVERWIAVPLGIVQVLLTAWLRGERARFVDALFAVGAWAALTAMGRAASVFGIETLADRLRGAHIGSITLSIAAVGAVIGSLALRRAGATSVTRRVTALAALAVIALESLRVDYLFDRVSIHHWGVFTGPAEAVRQGGWLLWDTPATYGFLSTLAIVATPAASVWDGFLWLNALACTVSAGILFWFLRRHMHALVALVLSLAAVLWLPGIREHDVGGAVLATPNAGPFRFVWCQALLAIAAWRPPRAAALVAGSLVWSAGCLWSSESAVYCSATWLPAYLLLIWGRPWGRRAAWLALPPLLIAAAVVAIEGYYRVHLGHGPDWYGFIEATVAVRGGVVGLPIDPRGPVAVLLLVGWTVATVAAITLRAPRDAAAWAPICAAFGLLWATSSYFVGRSHLVAVTNLLPTCCLIAAVLLRERGAARAVRPPIEALFAAVLLLALHEPSSWWPRGSLAQRWALGVEGRRPVMSAEQLELMQRAGIDARTPVVFYDWDVMDAWPLVDGVRPPEATWLPGTPFTELVPVPEERRALYAARFVGRTRQGGWLIDRPASQAVEGGGPWFFAALQRDFVRGPRHQVGRWRATRYDYVGPSAPRAGD